MLSQSSYSRAISADIGEIQRRLRALEKHLGRMGTRTSASAVEAADRLSDTVASALSSMADRFREFRESRSYDEVARLGNEAARLGNTAVRRLSDEVEHRPLVMLAVAVGVGILIGIASRRR
jgi:ElaB/YqjD/DUF883 family membrane-anchored ribosome-binding protein